jgi:flagellar hook assembly protein FlgD
MQITEITISDISGNVVSRLLSEYLQAGNYVTQWDGCDNKGNKLSNGTYLYQIKSGNSIKSGKVELLR